ncbi:DUF2244 domain-containing protein [Sandarakinorhabdus sp.]|uniref:DUF2244 domain-containing protein n=1 Tax=Sandarakinorhabdus sp. TaxID=1916663 RepID=UPI00286DD805|nr:DUF2244 domain-containing protein [Sandarakinorhabdus sp.]
MLLDLTLRPNRSFDRRHARWLIAAVGGLFFLGGLRFLALGAWPILPFMLADVLLLLWAFHSNYLSGGGHEHLALGGDDLTLTQVSPLGAVRVTRLEPYFTRVAVEETPLGDAHLFLESRGRRLAVGYFLSAPERRDVGAVIAAALSRYRAGGALPASV